MPKIIYVDADGTERPVEVKPGASVMEGAIRNNVPGIDAECGGACACATCHVFVDEAWLERTGPRTVAEKEMLQFVEGSRDNSRLSCQIKVTPELDGLVVHTPPEQISQL